MGLMLMLLALAGSHPPIRHVFVIVLENESYGTTFDPPTAAPDHATQQDCGRYEDFVETGMAPDGQAMGRGCVYPASVPTLANQLAARTPNFAFIVPNPCHDGHDHPWWRFGADVFGAVR
jgi:hypothetical protein